MNHSAALGQFLRYGLVGLASNGALYVAYLVLTAVGLEAKLTMTLLYAIGVAQTFFFNKRWSFRYGQVHGPAFMRYCVAYGFGYVVNLIALLILVDSLGYPHQIVQGLLVLLLAMILFLLQKFWVFPTKTSLPTASRSSRTV